MIASNQGLVIKAVDAAIFFNFVFINFFLIVLWPMNEETSNDKWKNG